MHLRDQPIMTTVVAVFDDLCQTQRAVADLIGSGFPRNVISVIIRHLQGPTDPANSDRRDLPAQSVLAGGPLGVALRTTSHDASAVPNTLMRAGLPLSASMLFAEAVSSGGILVAVHCKESAMRDARDILDIYAGAEPATRAGRQHGATTIGLRRADATQG